MKGILNKDINQFKVLLQEGKISASVIGTGRIGLPTAVGFANSGIPTIGFDINPDVVTSINNSRCMFKDEPFLEELLAKVVKQALLRATLDIKEAVSNSDIVVICLPTPLDATLVPNYRILTSSCKEVGKYLQDQSLVIIESTVGLGIVENQVVPSLSSYRNLKPGIDFGVASCPERANPSEIVTNLHRIPRIVGGINSKSTEMAACIYEHVFKVDVITLPNCKTANAVKLTENVFRDINIAFVNELAPFFDKLGIDIIDVLKACATKYNFIPHYPGPGVGGPCLPVNSYQLLYSATEINGALRLTRIAREINDSMPIFTVNLIKDALNDVCKPVRNSIVTVLGITYKPNVKDLQYSPMEVVVKKLREVGTQVKIYDPFYIDSLVFSQMTETTINNAIRGADCLVIGTAHREFVKIDLANILPFMRKPAALVDTCNIVSPRFATELGFIYRGIGRGFNNGVWQINNFNLLTPD